jgi:tetratricopeptide (TPR) repeat protein
MQPNPFKINEPLEVRPPPKAFKITLPLVLLSVVVSAVSVYLFVTHRRYRSAAKEYPGASYADYLLYPVMQETIRKKKGDYFIASAQLEEKKGDLIKARQFYEKGLELLPNEWRCRLKVVRMNLSEGYALDALDLLRAGLKLSSDESRYIDAVINIAWSIQDFNFMIEVCDVGLKVEKGAGNQQERITKLTEQKALALLSQGNPEKAIESLPKLAENAPVEQVAQRAILLLRLRLPVAAIQFLEEWVERYPGNLNMLRLLARARLQSGDLQGMEKTLAECVNKNPDARAAWSAMVVQRSLALDPAGAKESMERFFVKFFGNSNDLLALGLDLALINERSLIIECIAESDLQGFRGIELRKLLVEQEVALSNWDNATRVLGEIAVARGLENESSDRWQAIYESLCAAALDDDAEKQDEFVKRLQGEKVLSTPEAFERFIRLLSLERRYTSAYRIALIAEVRFPETKSWLHYAREFERLAPTPAVDLRGQAEKR